ncbi:hypothetical protein [Caldalkalibacillus mannanilyticus]|uniref:hypothetical protein n=1 Tax=Caldalkalibacillus mannanilyticus TaxID=1418 RepID=UPI0004692A03|nr:hypothetical protein [Caldalkalibacillus mannanilyticus]
MRKLLVLLLAMLLILNGYNGEAYGKASELEVKATWLWNPWMIVSDKESTLSFLESKNVNKVYLQIDPDISMDIYREFIEKASNKGISIYALDGSAEWVEWKGYIHLEKLMSWLGKYQEGSKATQKFSGIHLDVEPYLYSGWKTSQNNTIESYQALILKAKQSAETLDIPLEADIPFWFDEIFYKNKYGKGMLAEWVIAETDSVTIMAYRDSAEKIIEIVKTEIELASKYNKSIVIGVETGFSYEGGLVTFYEEGESYMNETLSVVEKYYSEVVSFNGIAVHHVSSWMAMEP